MLCYLPVKHRKRRNGWNLCCNCCNFKLCDQFDTSALVYPCNAVDFYSDVLAYISAAIERLSSFSLGVKTHHARIFVVSHWNQPINRILHCKFERFALAAIVFDRWNCHQYLVYHNAVVMVIIAIELEI